MSTKFVKGTLTERQHFVLTVLRNYHTQYGYLPSVRELCTLINVRSTNAVYEHLMRLEKHGCIERVRGKSRAIKLIYQAPTT